MMKTGISSSAKRGISFSLISTIALCIFCAWCGFFIGLNTSRSSINSESQSTLQTQSDTARQVLNAPLPKLNEELDSIIEPMSNPQDTRRNTAERNSKDCKCETSDLLSSRRIHSLCHKQLSTRGELPSYLTSLGLLGEGVEIGVRDGDFSQWVLSHWAGEKLHLVDPWAHQDVKLYNDKSNVGQKEQDDLHNGVVDMMTARFPGRFQVHRDYSVNAARNFKDSSLDYIYIDGRHDYAGVKEDLEAWYPKLREGGLFAGHDFVPDGILSTGDFGVQKGVSEFASLIGKEVQSISTKDVDGGRSEPQDVDGGWTTWYFIK
jgi:hypothetical protein